MMKNYDESVEIKHNQNWPYIPAHPYRILITDGSETGKTNVLLNLIKHQRPDINKIYLYTKDPFESKYQLLINEREKVANEKLKKTQRHSFIIHKQLMMFIKTCKKRRVLIALDDMISDMEFKYMISDMISDME